MLEHGWPYFDRGHYSLWTKTALQGRRWALIYANFWFVVTSLLLLAWSDMVSKVSFWCHFQSKVIGAENVTYFLHYMLRMHSECTYTVLKLIQTSAEDKQNWQQTQNQMLFPRWHAPYLVVIHAFLETAYGSRGYVTAQNTFRLFTTIFLFSKWHMKMLWATQVFVQCPINYDLAI